MSKNEWLELKKASRTKARYACNRHLKKTTQPMNVVSGLKIEKIKEA